MTNDERDGGMPSDDEVRLAQMRLLAEEDQWGAAWLTPPRPPPDGRDDARPYIRAMDDLLLAAARVIETGVGLSPVTVQLVRNSLVMYDAGRAVERGDLSATEYDNLYRWLNPGPEQNN